MGNINSHKILVEEPEGKRPLGRPRRRWEFKAVVLGYEDVDWIHVVQNRDKRRAIVNAVTNYQQILL
jgi:hypothetical protein